MDAGSKPAMGGRVAGGLGEDLAARYLELRGIHVIARNLRLREKEIDLLARDGDCLVCVEVKLRRGAAHGRASEGFAPRQRARLRAALRELVYRRSWRGDYRLDLVTIDLDRGGDRLVLEHFRGL